MQLVMAAMTTAPWPSFAVCPFISTVPVLATSAAARPKPRSFTGAVSECWKDVFICESGTRSCGRLGPARLGSTVERSRASVSVKTGSLEASVRNRPCSLQ